MKKTIKKLIALCLSLVLVASVFAACGTDTTEDDSPRRKSRLEETSDTEEKSNIVFGTTNIPAKDCWVAKTFGEVTDLINIDATNFSEGLAFVRLRDHNTYTTYVIDRKGELKFSLGELSADMETIGFHNGLSFVDDFSKSVYLIDTEGNKYTAEDFGGTEIYTKRYSYITLNFGVDMLKGGYFVVDKVATTYQGATYESAVYNSDRQQVQPYSEELYEFLHGSSVYQFYNGYIVKGECETYHIKTGSYGAFSDIPIKHKMDFTTFESDYDGEGMYRDGALVLDLSEYETLSNVSYIGDNGFAIFRNEEYELYFSVMDTQGNLKFDPIYYGRHNNFLYDYNESVIMTQTSLDQKDGTIIVQVKTYDWDGNELGTLEMTRSTSAASFIGIYFGVDSIVIENNENNTIGYYDMNLKPMFPVE